MVVILCCDSTPESAPACDDCGEVHSQPGQDCWNCGGWRFANDDQRAVRDRFCSVECADEYDQRIRRDVE